MTKKILFPVALLIFSLSTKAQTVDEIIKKYITAMGGYDNLKNLQTVIMNGKMVFDNGSELDISVKKSHEKGMRLDINKGKESGYDLITPTAGWQYLPFLNQKKPRKLGKDEFNYMVPDLDLQGPLVDYSLKGNKILFAGTEKVNGNDYFKLHAYLKNGKHEILYINTTTFYIDRVVAFIKDKQKNVPIVLNYLDYKSVNGILFPFTVNSPASDLKYQTIEINKPIDSSIFEKG